MLSGRQKEYKECHSVLLLIAQATRVQLILQLLCRLCRANEIRLLVSEMSLDPQEAAL